MYIMYNVQCTLYIFVDTWTILVMLRYGGGHGGYGGADGKGSGTTCVVKGSYCNCHYCKVITWFVIMNLNHKALLSPKHNSLVVFVIHVRVGTSTVLKVHTVRSLSKNPIACQKLLH